MERIVGRWIGSPWLRLAGAASLVVVVIVSLTPASVQPRTLLPGSVEHVVGYALVAATFTLGMRRTAFPWLVIFLLALFAIGVEALQLFSPGRNSEAIGAIASIAGVFGGAAVSYWVRSRVATAAGIASAGAGQR
jgi:VanZ family protein